MHNYKIPKWLELLVRYIKHDEFNITEELEDIAESFFNNIQNSRALTILFYEALIHSKAPRNADIIEKIREIAIKQRIFLEVQKHWLYSFEEVLNDLDISALLIKGAALDGLVYPRSSRISADLDFFLNQNDHEKVTKELVKRDLLTKKCHDFGFEETWVSNNFGNLEIDIHRGLTIPICYSVCLKEMWQRSCLSPVFTGGRLRIPCSEDQFIIIAANCARDMNYFNHRLIDTFLLITRTNIDGKRLYKIADSWGMGAILFAQLSALEEIGVLEGENKILSVNNLSKVRSILIKKFVKNTINLPVNNLSRRFRQLYSQWLLCDSFTDAVSYQGHYLISKTKL